MHDVHRESLIFKKKKKKKKSQDGPSTEDHSRVNASHDPDHHEHGHEDHSHDHSVPEGHDHEHEEEEYHDHDADLHTHKHHEAFGDRDMGNRAFAHLHEHEHTFYHKHHHNHDPEHTTLVHKVFKDPVRDWFGAFLMLILIYVGYKQLLPGNLSDGMLLCAAIIGVFPVIKNALLECISRRRLSIELFLGVMLLAGLFSGLFLEVAVAALLMLIGSFMRINFSWRN